MPYSPEYFDLQLRFAGLVAERLGLRLASAVTDYTAVQVSMDLGATPELRSRNWDRYCDGLASAEDATTWTYSFFLKHQPEFPGLQATHFSDRPLFGCFYYNTDVTQLSRKSSISPQYLGSTGFNNPQDIERLRNVSQ